MSIFVAEDEMEVKNVGIFFNRTETLLYYYHM